MSNLKETLIHYITISYHIIKLLRLNKSLIVFLFPIIGTISVTYQHSFKPEIFLCGLLYVLYWGASFAINDYYDISIDSINSPKRSLVSNQISPKTALILAVTIYIIINIVSLSAFGFFSLYTMLTITILGIIYSQKLKLMGTPGDIAIFIISTLGVLFGPISLGYEINTETYIIALCIGSLMYNLQIMYAIRDVEGDAINGSHSVAVKKGPQFASLLPVLVSCISGLILIIGKILGLITYNIILLIIGFSLLIYGYTSITIRMRLVKENEIKQVLQYFIYPEIGLLFVLFSFIII